MVGKMITDPEKIRRNDPGHPEICNVFSWERLFEVIIFMKGTPEEPACGFSARSVQILKAIGVGFTAVDILPDPAIREELSAISNWPTIPQLFVKGELVGGSDILMEMYESGELSDLIGVETYAPTEAK